MLAKVFLFAFLITIALSIRAHHNMDESRENYDHDEDYNRHMSNNQGIKGRSFNEVCEHYGGAVCDRFIGLGRKCCSKKGFFGRKSDKVCDTMGCEHDTVSISKMDWDYA